MITMIYHSEGAERPTPAAHASACESLLLLEVETLRSAQGDTIEIITKKEGVK
jgi:hypothetical protein